jgi:hypothetical protein
MAKLTFPIAALILAAAVVAFLATSSALQSLGNILVGAGLALGATYFVEEAKRSRLAKDLAIAIYHELANRAARCCYDFESPWSRYLEKPHELSRFTVAKFLPQAPTVFEANADKLALLGVTVPAALIAFYFRLAVIARDMENLREDAAGGKVSANGVHTIATRFAAALAPGLRALQALGAHVPNHRDIDDDAISTFDIGAAKRAPGTLRERLSGAEAVADEIEKRTPAGIS